MNVLVAFECSGVVREAFRRRGHNAWSCDLKDCEDGSPFHLQGDAFDQMKRGSGIERGVRIGWDMVIAHPPCTYLCNSGALHLYYKGKDGRRTRRKDVSRWSDMRAGAEMFARVFTTAKACGIKKVVAENPVMHGHALAVLRWELATLPERQTVQPYEFGDNASKRTVLWLVGVPQLIADPHRYIAPRMVNGKPRWANQTNSGQNKLGPSDHRQADRARTYFGLALAMADQWGAM